MSKAAHSEPLHCWRQPTPRRSLWIDGISPLVALELAYESQWARPFKRNCFSEMTPVWTPLALHSLKAAYFSGRLNAISFLKWALFEPRWSDILSKRLIFSLTKFSDLNDDFNWALVSPLGLYIERQTFCGAYPSLTFVGSLCDF